MAVALSLFIANQSAHPHSLSSGLFRFSLLPVLLPENDNLNVLKTEICRRDKIGKTKMRRRLSIRPFGT
jgi:hypothetical protein